MADAAVGTIVAGKAAYSGYPAVESGAMTLRTKSRSDLRRHGRRAVAERGDVVRYILYVALAQVGLPAHERDCANGAGDDDRGRGRRYGAADIRPDLSRSVAAVAERASQAEAERTVCAGLNFLDDRGMELASADRQGTMPDIRMSLLRHKDLSCFGTASAMGQEQ